MNETTSKMQCNGKVCVLVPEYTYVKVYFVDNDESIAMGDDREDPGNETAWERMLLAFDRIKEQLEYGWEDENERDD